MISFLNDITSARWAKTAARARLRDLVYRSLRAVKVLLAALRSTLTVLAPRMGGRYRLRSEEQLLVGNSWLSA